MTSWLPARARALPRPFDAEAPVLAHVLVRVVVVALAVAVLPPIFVNDVTHYWEVGRHVGVHHLPYRGFLWEFPPLTTAALLLVPLSGGHLPVFATLFVAAAVAAEVLTWREVRALLPVASRPRASWYWLAVVVPLSSIAYFRLDWPSALFGAVAVGGLVRGSPARVVAGVLGGFGVKLWTLVLVVPLVALRRTRHAALAVAACAALVAAWWAASPAGLRAFWRFRQGTGFQVESLPGSLVLLLGHHRTHFLFGAVVVSDAGWAWVDAALPAVLVVAAGGAALGLRRRRVDPVALSGALVVLVVLTSRLVSPQYLVWVVPFAVLLLPRSRVLGWAFAAVTWLTLVEIDRYDYVVAGTRSAASLVVVRNAVLLLVLAELCRLALVPTRSRTAELPGQRQDRVLSGSGEEPVRSRTPAPR